MEWTFDGSWTRISTYQESWRGRFTLDEETVRDLAGIAEDDWATITVEERGEIARGVLQDDPSQWLVEDSAELKDQGYADEMDNVPDSYAFTLKEPEADPWALSENPPQF